MRKEENCKMNTQKEVRSNNSIGIACMQMASSDGEARDDRIRKAEGMLKQLYKSSFRPAQILFPEIWATGFFAFDHYLQESEPEKGNIFEMMGSWSRKLGCYIHTGSFVEKDGENYYNTSLLLDPKGKIAGKYRKIHLFGYGSRENELLTPGSRICTVKTEYGIIGLATCYDLRFPEQFRAMTDRGAHFFLISSAWPAARSAHWKLFNQVRAVENQSFLISCNSCGTQAGNDLAGLSMIIGPEGEIIRSGGSGEEILTAGIIPDQADEYRSSFPALADRRPLK